jgi:UDP-N-acetylglucosamine diphosphorylase / glucose-1-phosphate thymidylyltransferase / UDP-N-acetylgalactosamine diphosphorylase / glucosamine-1-phosphate N-acetyltransferase / galactosamine-1-phosphate N-acetyltransferase
LKKHFLKIILQDERNIRPFNERARDLRIMNKPLWLIQRDVLAPYTDREMELPCGAPLPETTQASLVYRDNLFFDEHFIRAFLQEAVQRGSPCRAAFSIHDPAFREHALPLSTSYTRHGDIYLVDLWYFPHGPTPESEPLVIDLQSTEVGYYHVPTYMAYEQGDLVFQVPLRSLLAIDTWVHIFIADVVYGLFSRGARFEARLKNDPIYKLSIMFRGMYEGKQVLSTSELVQVGHNCVIDPDAIIHGPTTIGNNVTIGAGAVIENCIIGDNANISQGCQLMLSVVGDGAFLPFRASMFMTTLMDNSMVAQNTCLQMCVVGRNTFLGAGSTFTDYNLLTSPIRAIGGDGKLSVTNRPVLGGCVGHNCRIGAGMIIFPARTIESDVVMFASEERRVISRDVVFEESDHHKLRFKDLHPRLYPRPGETTSISW